jgi:hypothetical protein
MNTYKITHLSGRVDTIEDQRSIEDLTAALCQDGYLIVEARGSGYSGKTKPLSVLERAVATIEPLD